MNSRPLARHALLALALLSPPVVSVTLAAQAPRVQTLENGLRVVLLEDHASPQIAAAIWVHVGSKDETEDLAGFAHFLEHLIPQGTKGRPPRAQQLEIFQAGGIASVQADYDRTFFFFSAPKEALDLALEGLLQQVSQAELSGDAANRIRPAVKLELKEIYDDPRQVLFLEQMRAAFPGQPYRVPHYGSFQGLELLEHSTADAFYGNFYVSNNMVLAVGGDIQPSRVMEKIRARFGALKPSKTLPPKAKFGEGLKEPRQVVKNLGNLPPSVSLLFPTPGYRHPDRPALAVLGRLLLGASGSLSAGGGAEGGTIASATAGFHLLEERGLLALTAHPVSAQAAVAAGESLARTIARIRAESFPEAEIRKTIKAMRLETAVRRDAVGSLTQELAEAVLFGDVRHGWDYPASLEKVSAADLRRVATNYLVAGNCATLLVLPKQESKPAEEALERLSEAVAAMDAKAEKAPRTDFSLTAYPSGAAPITPRKDPKPPAPAARHTLPNGLTVVFKPSPGRGLAAISLHARAGFAFDPPGKEGTAQMVAAFLPLGATAAGSAEFRERAAALGSSFGLTASLDTMETGLTVFPEDLPAALDLVATAVLSPAFPGEHLEPIRERMNRYRESLARAPGPTARDLSREKIFRDHPYARPSLGTETSLRKVTREDLITFHRKHYRPDRSVLTVAGEFDSAATRTRIASAFGGWTASGTEERPPELPDASSPEPLSGQFSRLVDTFPSEVLLAFPGLPLRDPQFPMLRALGTILGARGFVDLVLNQGVALSVQAGLEGFSRGGVVRIEATSAPENASRVAYELLLRARNLALTEMTPKTLGDVLAVERGRLLREQESLYTLSSNLAFYELVGPGFATYDERKTLPAELTPARLKEAAARFLDASKLVRISAGPASP